MVMVVFFHVDDLIVMGNTKQFKEKFLGLEGLGLSDYKPVSTPLTPGLHLKTSDKDDHNNFLALNLNY